ncbi:unnamed protein product [Gongylonema pulchrum]|uniref:MARVEL domain-containing protein n=1 Tax=Gongylonema pulchrum TaxID=637853 RepID=A0A183D9U5_9BILA|nr:unnamed protein product [Gongylonema pulchrum]
MNDITRSVFHRDLFNCERCSERPRVISVVFFLCAAAICITWFIVRRNPYAFVLLDLINIAWLTVLLLCMFVYDLFMVFITPFLTRNGCSVMVEVAAGVDCSKQDFGYPIAPINVDIPEKVNLFSYFEQL